MMLSTNLDERSLGRLEAARVFGKGAPESPSQSQRQEKRWQPVHFVLATLRSLADSSWSAFRFALSATSPFKGPKVPNKLTLVDFGEATGDAFSLVAWRRRRQEAGRRLYPYRVATPSRSVLLCRVALRGGCLALCGGCDGNLRDPALEQDLSVLPALEQDLSCAPSCAPRHRDATPLGRLAQTTADPPTSSPRGGRTLFLVVATINDLPRPSGAPPSTGIFDSSRQDTCE